MAIDLVDPTRGARRKEVTIRWNTFKIGFIAGWVGGVTFVYLIFN